ncbi:MAG: hypothetical protein NVS4B3_21110 [Gemmatimonadaceae bacterium]
MVVLVIVDVFFVVSIAMPFIAVSFIIVDEVAGAGAIAGANVSFTTVVDFVSPGAQAAMANNPVARARRFISTIS